MGGKLKEPVIKTYFDNNHKSERSKETNQVKKTVDLPQKQNFSSSIDEKKAFIVGLITINVIVLIIILWMVL